MLYNAIYPYLGCMWLCAAHNAIVACSILQFAGAEEGVTPRFPRMTDCAHLIRFMGFLG